ncbi:MAG: hemerythrin domain-containing protein [Hyphomicrobiales bacterium]
MTERMKAIAMELRRHVSRALHQDHVATLALLDRLVALLGRHGRSRSPQHANADNAQLLKELIRAIDSEIGPHFAFEEDSVFPLLAEAGDREMSALLIDEHQAILPLARRLAAIAKSARDAGFAAEAWGEFHDAGGEFIERLASHIQKEEMALLPALDDLLDEEADGRLAIEFAARR